MATMELATANSPTYINSNAAATATHNSKDVIDMITTDMERWTINMKPVVNGAGRMAERARWHCTL